MADIATGVAAVLLGSASVTAVVGRRVFPQWSRMVDNAYPLAVYKVDGVTPTQTYADGTSALESCNLAVACIGKTYADAVAAARAVKNALDNASGTWGGVVVQGCFLNDDGVNDDVVTEPESESILYHVRELTFLAWYVNA